MTSPPLALLTNDDGIRSRFLAELAQALAAAGFEVHACAPADEQSWIGHAISRRAILRPEEVDGFPGPAHQLNGTPADCVNFALGHLLPRPPEIVVSGINLGYNVTLPMVLSSGTVGAALEGALHGHRAIAASMALPPEHFEEIRANHGQVDDPLHHALRQTARHVASYAKNLCRRPPEEGLLVHNLNFPENTTAETLVLPAFPQALRLGSLFQPRQDGQGHSLVYRAEWLDQATPQPGSDLHALKQNKASAAPLDFAAIRAQ